MPDPDLVIRTGGDMRLSNFLLWQAAYAELYVTPHSGPTSARATLPPLSTTMVTASAATASPRLR